VLIQENTESETAGTHSSINNTNHQQEFFEVLDQNTLTTTMHQAHITGVDQTEMQNSSENEEFNL
jgi:hypothetical protein